MAKRLSTVPLTVPAASGSYAVDATFTMSENYTLSGSGGSPTVTLYWQYDQGNGTWIDIPTSGATGLVADSGSQANATATTTYSRTITCKSAGAYVIRARGISSTPTTVDSTNQPTTTVDVAPAAPTDMVTVSKTDVQVVTSWTDNSNNETGFNCYVGGVLAGTVGANIVTYTFIGLSPSTQYTFTVKATNNGVESSAATDVETTDAEVGGTVFESNTTENNWGLATYVGDSQGQTFTPQAFHTIFKVRLRLTKTGSPTGDITMSILDVNQGVLCVSNPIAMASIAAVDTIYTFTFTTNPVLLAGTVYTMSLVCTGGDASNWIGIDIYDSATVDIYPRGAAVGQPTYCDWYFVECGEVHAAPTTAVLTGYIAQSNVGWIEPASANEHKVVKDSLGHLYVVYLDDSDADGNHGVYCNISTDGGLNWTQSLIATGYWSITDPSIAIDANDNVYVAYIVATNQYLPWGRIVKRAQFNGSSWIVVNLYYEPDDTNYTLVRTDICVDSMGHTHVIFERWHYSNYQLVYKLIYYSMDTDAATQIVDDTNASDTFAYCLSIASTYDGDIYVTWMCTDFKYIKKHNGSWGTPSTIRIGGSTNSNYGLSIPAVDTTNKVHIAYIVGNNLYYAQYGGSAWTETVLVTNGILTGNLGVTITVDAHNAIHIVFDGKVGTTGVRQYIGCFNGVWTDVAIITGDAIASLENLTWNLLNKPTDEKHLTLVYNYDSKLYYGELLITVSVVATCSIETIAYLFTPPDTYEENPDTIDFNPSESPISVDTGADQIITFELGAGYPPASYYIGKVWVTNVDTSEREQILPLPKGTYTFVDVQHDWIFEVNVAHTFVTIHSFPWWKQFRALCKVKQVI